MRHHVRLLFAMVLFAALAAAESPAFIGAWENPKDPGDKIAFEVERVMVLSAGSVEYHRAHYGADGTVRLGWRGEENLHAELKEGALTVRLADGKTTAYRKIAGLPKEMQTQAMVMAKSVEMTPGRRIALVYQAGQHLQRDQEVRADPAQAAQIDEVAASNAAWLKETIAELGWPDATRCGREIVTPIIIIVQHSGDIPLMLGALPCFEAELKAKLMDPQDYALLYDQVQLLTGRKQRYGTQTLVGEDGSPTVFPLEDRAKLDGWRKAIGLMPFAEYLEWFGGKPVYMDDLPLAALIIELRPARDW